MLRYHDLIVAINFDVQEVNISNLLKILDNFYIFIRLEREKNLFWPMGVGNLQFEHGNMLPKPMTRFLKFFISSIVSAICQKWLLSMALAKAQEKEEPGA